ncbi:Pimeloyl-ACP methyl ester carboxylesterase [Sphingomonas sp. YR710]|uniref:alpha/beta fold hydrolase n=1 Tax=Sphingomonas sp. YR710 TaxID=1882773 RepID=UPI0008903225|nr:alpha/beta hydrolase [Sphingomonas sp. YR710]SDC52142.1 Pimeloyl-ACP methyl ester carboxylesterase [Sphingomonas sp. YR710]
MIDLSGVHIHYQAQGAGHCAILVHGMGGDLHGWDRLWPLLDAGRRWLRYDLRDFGRSTARSDAAFTHVDDLAELLDALAIDRCDLVGASMGGGVALRFALDHPDRVGRLVLISPQIAGWEWSEGWQARWEPMLEAARAGRMEEAKRLWWLHPMFDTIRERDAADDLRREIARFAGRQWLRDNHALVMPDIERLHTLRPATLLLTGEADMAEFQLMADIIESSSSQVRRIVIPGRGHLLHLEAPERCAEEFATFLNAAAAV